MLARSLARFARNDDCGAGEERTTGSEASAADVRAISEELFRPEYLGLTVLGDIDRDALASINMDC